MSDRSARGRAVYARNLGVDEAEAERLLVRRAGVEFVEEGLTALMVLLTAYVGQPYTSVAMETVRPPVVAGNPHQGI